ncbi:MAG TPA: hypothetical protein VND45_12650 [Thermoanaerobaculia bacterium]|nr:hypothetical protein [Thermoanaerobaculia bacterium]
MKTIVALFVFFGTIPLFGQYNPPARDIEEATKYVVELSRQLEPAMKEARDQAVVFTVVARAHNMLLGKEPAAELTSAKKILDDFLEQRERSGNELSRENLKTLASVRQELELAQPPYAIAALRERLHHQFVHPLELQALRDLQRMEQMEKDFAMIVERHFAPVRRATMSGIEITAKAMKND